MMEFRQCNFGFQAKTWVGGRVVMKGAGIGIVGSFDVASWKLLTALSLVTTKVLSMARMALA